MSETRRDVTGGGLAEALLEVHARYFDLDGEPGVDATEPEPEDVWRYDRDFRAAVAAATACYCPPCPGRGNDGHGMTHCAECCFGSGVEADPDCPAHGVAAATAETPPTPEATTVTEWGVRGVLPEPNPDEVWQYPSETPARATARHPKYGGTVVSRQRTSFTDVVTEWTEHAEDTTGGMG